MRGSAPGKAKGSSTPQGLGGPGAAAAGFWGGCEGCQPGRLHYSLALLSLKPHLAAGEGCAHLGQSGSSGKCPRSLRSCPGVSGGCGKGNEAGAPGGEQER